MHPHPFRGSDAVAGGRVTRRELQGPRFRRLFHDIYVFAEVEVDLALRSRAASVLTRGRGVLGGWSAAELLGASCGPIGTPAEILVPDRRRPQPGLVIRHEVLPPDELTTVRGIAVTTPLRTAYDLARRRPALEAVVAVDALAHAHPFVLSDIMALNSRHLGGAGCRQLPEVIRRSDRLAESPMETRIRIAIIDGGLPLPVLQHRVGPYALDMAYPGIRLGVEYDGRDHLTQERAMRDLTRQAALSNAGWHILRFRAHTVLTRPDEVATTVREHLMIGRRCTSTT